MRRALCCALLLAVATSAAAAPFATLHERIDGRDVTTALRIEGARLIARIGDRDAWTLAVARTGPTLAAGGAADVPCDATLEVTLARDDTDGDGRIDHDRGERARLFAAASWRAGNAWRSAVLAIELRGNGAPSVGWVRDSSSLTALGRAVPAPVRVRWGPKSTDLVVVASGWPRDPLADALASGGELLLFDAATGASLPSPFRSRASFTSGVTAVDVDADGIDDRLYFADAGWQLWRVDRDGTRFESRRLADLSAYFESGAALTFAPDVALAGTGEGRRLDVSLGTSDAPARRAPRHWLFVLHDPLGTAPALAATILPLPGPLAAPVLTVAGKPIIATRARPAASCAVHVTDPEPLSVSVGLPQSASATQWIRIDSEPGARLSLQAATEGSAARLECRLGSRLLPQCPDVERVTRDYWVRRDAP